MLNSAESNKLVPELTKEDFFRPNENVYIHISSKDTKYDGVIHKHKFIEIVYVISGKAIHLIGNNKYSVQRGDIVIVNYDTPHAFYEDKQSSENFVTYDLLFTPDFFDISQISGNGFETLASSFLFYTLFPEDIAIESNLKLINSNHSEFHDIFNKIYMEYSNMEKGYSNIIRSSLIELITKIFRKIDNSPYSSITNKQKQLVDNAIDYLRENYNTHINLENVVADMFLSKNYFRQLFKSTTGLSITSFIQKTRIEEACNLLTTTTRTIADISEECGFNDIKFFYSTFKKYKGKTPGEYRKNN